MGSFPNLLGKRVTIAQDRRRLVLNFHLVEALSNTELGSMSIVCETQLFRLMVRLLAAFGGGRNSPLKKIWFNIRPLSDPKLPVESWHYAF